MSKNSTYSISEFIKQYFQERPYQDINHGPVVDWVEERYVAKHAKKPRDTWRAIRKLHEEGCLIKVKKGVYRYDPDVVSQREFSDFSEEQKQSIFARDGFKCVICGKCQNDGVELHADHIKPKYLGGQASIENGQTLCAQHNFLKKSLKQTETGKKMFIRLYELAKCDGDENLVNFCRDVLSVFEKHDINGHVTWEK